MNFSVRRVLIWQYLGSLQSLRTEHVFSKNSVAKLRRNKICGNGFTYEMMDNLIAGFIYLYFISI